jgi:hypothetical protein
MKGNLDQLATKAIHSGITSKYTSINTKDGHIEFRSPGGDWLGDNFDQIENTLLRFTVAMSAALNPEMYRQEYLTKLYKLLSENDKGNTDTIKYFSEYVAGKIPQAALRSFVKQAQLQRSLAKGKVMGPMWWNVQWDNNRRIEVVAGSAEVAKQVAAEEWGVPESQLAGAVVTPLRPYKKEPKGPTLNGRPSNPDGNYVIVDVTDETKPVYRYMAASAEDTLLVLRQWIAANPGQVLWNYKYDPDQRLGQPGDSGQPATQNVVPGSTVDLQRQRAAQQEIPEVPLDIEIAPPRSPAQPAPAGNSFSGQWRVMIDGEEVWRFRGVGNNQADANRIAQTWILDQIRNRQLNPVDGADVEVLPVMI